MKNSTVQLCLPDLNRTIPMNLKNLALQAIPDGSITIIDTPDGWVVTMAKPNLSVVLATDRGPLRFYASLDTAVRQLADAGISMMLIRTGGERP